MNNNSENNSANNPLVVNEFSLGVTAIKIVVLAIFLVPLVKYTLISKQVNETDSHISLENKSFSEENIILQENITQHKNRKIDMVNKVIIVQPVCPKSEIILLLKEICTDIVFKYSFCSPEDIHNPKKHKIPKYYVKNKSKKDPKGK